MIMPRNLIHHLVQWAVAQCPIVNIQSGRLHHMLSAMNRIPDADDQAAQLARMERLCVALDNVRQESARLYAEITAEARRASAAVSARGNSCEAW